MRALPLYVLLLMDFVHLLSLFFSSFFSFLTHLFPFSLCLLSITSLKDKFVELLQSKKKLVCLFPFTVCLFFQNFSFYSHMFLNILLFKFSFLNVLSSVTPFLCVSFSWGHCLVWSSYFFSFFFKFSFHILSLFTRRHVFWIVSVCTVSLISCLLVLEKCSFVFSPSSSQEKLENDNLFYFFLTFFFEFSTFSTQTLSEKKFMFCVFRSLLIFVLLHLFFMSFFNWFFSISIATCFPFWNVFFTSLFSLLVHPLSICSYFCLLLFSRFFHLFSLFKLPFFCFFSISMFLYVKLFVWKYLFKLLRNSFSAYFSLGLFSMFGPFLCREKWSRFITRLFLILLLNSVSLFSPFWCIQKIRMCFCPEMWEKLSFVFCFCSHGLKTFLCEKIRFIFHFFRKYF